MTNLSDHFLSFVETSDANTKLYAPEHPLRASISVARTPRQPNPLRDSSTTDELIELLRNKKPLHISAQSSLTRKPLFSADRYYAKHGREDADAESWEEAGAETAKEATDVFRIESVAFASLVAQSSDDVATEARALLRQWIDAAPVSRRVRCNEARTSDDSESAEMRRVLHSAVGIEAPPKVVSTLLPRPKPPTLQEPRVSAALRQSLAKQRRELAELKRRTELGRRLDEGRDASQKHSFVHEWEAEMSRKLFKKASVEGVEDARRKAHEERERLVEAQREKQTIEELARYEQEQHRRKREDCERKRTYARAKVVELYLLKTLKVLSPLFSAWRDHTAKQNMNLQSLLVLQTWKNINRTWVRWKTTKRRREGHRQSEQLALTLKRNHENQTKADRHFRMTILSKVYLSWYAWHKIEMENKKLQHRHQERAQKMKNFLEALEKEIHAAQDKKGIQAVAVGSRIMTYSNASVASNTGQGQPGATLKIRKTKLKEIIHTSPIKIETPEVPVVTQVTAVAQAAEQNDFDQKASVHKHPLKSPSKKPDIKSLKSHNAIVDKMKKREAERRERRADAESRRKEREAALQAQKEAEEKARIEGEESERKKFLEQKKEERRLAQQAEQEKERQRTRRIQLHQKAAMHNCKRIMKAIGWMPWKVFVACHRQDIVLASEFRQKWDLLSKLLQWRKKLARKRTEVEMIAIHFYQSKLLRKAWTSLREKKVALGERLANAIHFSRESQKKCFQKVWYQKTKESIFYRYQLERERELAADALAAKLAPRRFLRKWHAITSEQKEGRWREWRRNQLRSRIKEMLTTSTFEEKLKREYTPHRKLNSAFNVDDEEMP